LTSITYSKHTRIESQPRFSTSNDNKRSAATRHTIRTHVTGNSTVKKQATAKTPPSQNLQTSTTSSDNAAGAAKLRRAPVTPNQQSCTYQRAHLQGQNNRSSSLTGATACHLLVGYWSRVVPVTRTSSGYTQSRESINECTEHIQATGILIYKAILG
jgi:hypothetical protein